MLQIDISYSHNPYFILEVNEVEMHSTYSFQLTRGFQQESRDLFILFQTLNRVPWNSRKIEAKCCIVSYNMSEGLNTA